MAGHGSTATPPFQAENGRVWQEKELAAGIIVFLAEGIRKERTGVHAKLYIALKTKTNKGLQILAWSNLNVERNGDRSRLCREANSQAGKILSSGYNLIELTNDFNSFCLGLYEASLMEFKADRLKGSLTPAGPTFLLKPFVIEGGGTILFAPPGRGKSFIGLIMSIAIDSGQNGLWQTQQRNVLFINLERSRRSIEDRMGAVNMALDLRPDRELLVLSARGKSLAEIRSRAEVAVKEHKIDVIVLDSISRTGFGTLVEDKPANQIIDVLNSLSPTWIALAHTPRSDEGHIFGSVMFDAGIDIGVQLITEHTDNMLGCGLKMTKANDTPLLKDPDILALTFGETGLLDVRRAEKGEFVHVESQQPRSPADRIVEYLGDAGKDYGKAISDELDIDASLVTRILKNDNRIVRVNKDGNRIYYGLRARGEEC